MKTIITLNSRQLHRALCTLLLCFAALWVMPGSARAQVLYVAQSHFNTSVGKYDATTGAAINANFITGLGYCFGLALSGNNLFVASADNDTVGEYNATTGAAINTGFITGTNFFPYVIPDGLALSGNTLFVSNYGSGLPGAGSVGEYDATTGAVINANFVTGLNEPQGLAVSGNTLFVANYGNNSVGEYNAITGATINANFIPPSPGLNGPEGLLVAPIPEPSTWSMIAVGGVALLGIMLRKKHRIA